MNKTYHSILHKPQQPLMTRCFFSTILLASIKTSNLTAEPLTYVPLQHPSSGKLESVSYLIIKIHTTEQS